MAIRINKNIIKDVYSEEDHFTGKLWIDGKKIYRRVFELGTLGNDSPTEYNLISDFEYLIKSTFYLSLGNVVVTLPIMNSGYITNVYATCNGAGSIQIVAERQNKNQYPEWKVNAILEYTKTTDKNLN